MTCLGDPSAEKCPTQNWSTSCEVFKMKCRLCWCITRNEADFSLTFDRDDRVLRVCHYCKEDLSLLGFNANQVVRLPSTAKHLVTVVCGSGLSLFMEARA